MGDMSDESSEPTAPPPAETAAANHADEMVAVPASNVVEGQKGMVVMPGEVDVPIAIEDMVGGLPPAPPEGSGDSAPASDSPPASAEE
jgi:hypothetical protein